MIRSAIATWRGSPAIGEGAVTTTSGVMSNALYSFGSSTGSEPCTSPSEMLAAAIASCASLMVAQEMAKAHIKYEHVKTEAVLTLQEKTGHWDISAIELNVSSISQSAKQGSFKRQPKLQKGDAPISRALNVPIKLTAKLEPVEEAALV